MSAQLVITTDEGVVLRLRLGEQPLTIGRSEESVLMSSDRRASRRPLVIRMTEDGGFELEDRGSSYGTLLNGRSVTREKLADKDVILSGGLHLQFLSGESGADEAPPPVPLLVEVEELRRQVRTLIDEEAELRRQAGRAEEVRRAAERERDEEHDEANRLRELVSELREREKEQAARIESLGQELLNQRSQKGEGGGPKAAASAQKQVQEAQKQAEWHRARAIELEEREARVLEREAALKKEVERLTQINQQIEKRAADMERALKPAAMKIAQQNEELEKLRMRLAQVESDFEIFKKGGR